jgi:nitronate monooxygenase
VKTALTDLLGTRLPILAGGLHWLANADYVAAAARAGIMGFITAASFPDDDALRAEIRKCRALCEGAPFGVNVSMLPKLVQGERTQQIFDLICEEQVGFVETSGRNPEAYLPGLKAAGVKVIHKVPAVRFAAKAQSIGVDAVAIVGAECGGHPGLDMIGSFVQARMAKDALTIPYIIGGGVGTGEQMVAALAMGASGVVVGTRFLVAEEIWAHRGFKERLIAASERDTDLILSSLRNTMRVLKNDTAAEVKAIEDAGQGSLETLLPLVSGKVGRQAYLTGDCSKGALAVGQAAVFADAIEPLAAIVARFEAEAEGALARLRSLG